jgi:hypothetical protein
MVNGKKGREEERIKKKKKRWERVWQRRRVGVGLSALQSAVCRGDCSPSSKAKHIKEVAS